MKKPILLHYYVTDACNARCEFCDVWNNKNPSFAKLDNVTANLRDARNAGCSFVDFTGGEPTLNPDLPKFLTEAKKLGFITSVTTNTMNFKRRAKELSGLVDLLHFSLDADTAELHDKIRGVKSFHSVIDAIEIAKKYKLTPDLLFTYTNENIDHFQGVVDIANQNKLMVILDPLFSTNGENLLKDETHRKAKAYAKQARVYLNHGHLSFRNDGSNKLDNPRCHAVDAVVVIKSNNTLAYPCYHNSVETTPIDNNLSALLRSEKREHYRKTQGKLHICESCHINCYMDPSYGYGMDKYMALSMLSKLRYGIRKYLIDGNDWSYLWKRHVKKLRLQ